MSKKYILFCYWFLRTHDIGRSAALSGWTAPEKGIEILSRRDVEAELERQRELLFSQLKREDILLRLAKLAFSSPGDCIKLAGGELDGGVIDSLDLDLISEFKRSGGVVEVKLIDRLKVLEALNSMLGSMGGEGLRDFLKALEDTGP